MTHAEMDDLYGLYSLGALDYQEAVEIDTHLADGCEYCLNQIHEAVSFTAGISVLAEPVTPAKHVRDTVLAAVSRAPVARRMSWPFAVWPAAACVALAAVLSFSLFQQTRQTRRQLHQALTERDQLRSALEILTERQTRTVRFGADGDSAHGYLFVNRDSGFVFVGSNLPPIADNRIFELWLVPAKGNPAPAGLVRPNNEGNFVLTSQTRLKPSEYAAVAVTVEPTNGSAAPTTKPFLVVPLKE